MNEQTIHNPSTHAKIMGILNTTPDSFYDGGRYATVDAAVEHALVMVQEGADIIDVGGESTRPPTAFHQHNGLVTVLSEDEEKKRVLPTLKKLKDLLPNIVFSIDTRKVSVAQAAIAVGAKIINYVTEEVQVDMAQTIAAHPEVSVVICHMRGKPQTMQAGSFHEGPMVPYLETWFRQQIARVKDCGVQDQQIILDPGLGFGKKKPDQDLEILRGLSQLKKLGYPLLLGLSRKSFMGHILDKPATELLSASLGLNAFALMQGVDYLRVHDVKEHKDLVQVLSRV